MPVTIRPQPKKVGVNKDPVVFTSKELLAITSRAWVLDGPADRFLQTNKRPGPEDRQVLRTSFEDLDGRQSLIPFGNGFVDGILRAFQQDLHLVLRPDDVWLAILVQFSFYVTGHAEELRHSFVNHDGKEIIKVNMAPLTLKQVDFGTVSQKIIESMKTMLVDESLTDWLVPDFSTTTPNDKTVSALVLMATMKSYFEYHMTIGCGFPSITLEGDKADWVNLGERVKRFAQYGEQPADWSTCLSKTIEKMASSFDKPDAPETKDFWLRACHSAGVNGSGQIETLSGWITAFSFWDDTGRCLAIPDETLRSFPGGQSLDRKRLILDGVAFPVIGRTAVPKSVSDVPMIVDDYESGQKLHTTLVAGIVAMQGTEDDEKKGSSINKVQPRSGWWMLLDKTEPL